MVHAWNRDFVANSDSGKKYDQLAKDIDRALAFMHACGADPVEFRSVEFFTAHEALLLDYEKAMSRTDYVTGRTYDTSAHFLWMGGSFSNTFPTPMRLIKVNLPGVLSGSSF